MIELINLLYDSQFSLLISDTSSEHIKEHLISQFSPIDMTSIKESRILRDLKINEATNTKQYYLFDIMTIPSTQGLERAKVVRQMVRQIQSHVSDNNRVIISSASYTTPSDKDQIESFSNIGGSSPILAADCVISFYKRLDKFYYSIIKNRFGLDKKQVLLKEFNRDSQIDKIIC